MALLTDTANFVDGEYVDLGIAQIIGTVTLQDPTLGNIKIFVARNTAIEKFIPKIALPDDEEEDEEE